MKIASKYFLSESITKKTLKLKGIFCNLDVFLSETLQFIVHFLKKKAIVLSVTAIVLIVPLFTRVVVWQISKPKYIVTIVDDEKFKSVQQKIEREISILEKKLDAKRPKSYYLVINSSSNEFNLYKSDKMIKKDKCSTGSYILLKNGEQQQWMFNTPKGEFRVLGKSTSPVWKKPDWAFVEEGLPVPSENHHTRFEYGVLGDYALNLGDGYLIHGTLYQRFLGLPVTHGCIRLNDENLELVYGSLEVGSKVYIF